MGYAEDVKPGVEITKLFGDRKLVQSFRLRELDLKVAKVDDRFQYAPADHEREDRSKPAQKRQAEGSSCSPESRPSATIPR